MKIENNLSFRQMLEQFAVKTPAEAPKGPHYCILVYTSFIRDTGTNEYGDSQLNTVVEVTQLVFENVEDFLVGLYLCKTTNHKYNAFQVNKLLDVHVEVNAFTVDKDTVSNSEKN